MPVRVNIPCQVVVIFNPLTTAVPIAFMLPLASTVPAIVPEYVPLNVPFTLPFASMVTEIVPPGYSPVFVCPDQLPLNDPWNGLVVGVGGGVVVSVGVRVGSGVNVDVGGGVVVGVGVGVGVVVGVGVGVFAVGVDVEGERDVDVGGGVEGGVVVSCEAQDTSDRANIMKQIRIKPDILMFIAVSPLNALQSQLKYLLK
ncbi:MAG: hypothetical protein ACYDG5_05205 [Dehalococcoidales bacterium]